MNYYHIWCNLKESHKDLEFSRHLTQYLGHLQSNGLIAGFRLTRRKLGFGPDQLGEFHIVIECRDLAQLDQAFGAVAPRKGEVESHHRSVYEMVTDFRSALYRDFPDPERSSQ
jgi:hypothetical protein